MTPELWKMACVFASVLLGWMLAVIVVERLRPRPGGRCDCHERKRSRQMADEIMRGDVE